MSLESIVQFAVAVMMVVAKDAFDAGTTCMRLNTWGEVDLRSRYLTRKTPLSRSLTTMEWSKKIGGDEHPTYALSKLNSTTWLVIHNDQYYEFPYIYVKLYSHLHLAVVFDTGCGTKYSKGHEQPAELKTFIQERILPKDSSSNYGFMVICTHCHFDHIGGIQPFHKAGAHIVASAFEKDFLSGENLDENSLCPAFNIPTPKYDIGQFAGDHEPLNYGGTDLKLLTLHTPGHTPDSMAVYDSEERWLFTGDTCYQRVAEMPWGEQHDVPIVFPLQGNWKHFMSSLTKLKEFAVEQDQSATGNAEKVRMACGHTTSAALAVDFLERVHQYASNVAAGNVRVAAEIPGDQVAPGGSLGNDIFVLWQDEGNPEFSLIAPQRIKDEF
jgi:glyoxylase-like metal-dependent hydrolase (beta-lactamase superfamily II)